MNIASVSIRRPVLASVLSIVIVIFGVVGFELLGLREYPSVDPPVVTVSTTYAGANADVIEAQITEPLEESINGIAGIRTLTSSSADGRSSISVEFNLGVDMEAATNDVRDRVSRAVRNLPQDVDPPVVTKADADSDPIIILAIQSTTRNLLELSEIGNNVFKERLQTIPGVSEIRIFGEKKYAMKLNLDPALMAARNITPSDIRQSLLMQNVELPSGRIEGYQTELTIRTLGRLETEDDFNNLIIKDINGKVVRLKDVGTARLAPENERSLLRGNGGIQQIALAITPQPGVNHIAIADEFYKRKSSLEAEMPEDLVLAVTLDTTISIRKAITEVQETILLAFALVVLVIFLFLRHWRTTLIPVIAIPISLVGTFFVMYLSGFTINILTLLGIVLATGLVVDDAIVVLENIFSKIESGLDPVTAGHKGSQEIIFAIISTTITLAVVFLPIIFLQGLTGRLFREFAVVVAAAVVISAFVSLTLTPMMSSKMLRHQSRHTALFLWSERFFNNMTTGYHRSLAWMISHRWISLVVMGVAVLMVVGIGSLLQSELAPMEDKSRLRVIITSPEGTAFEAMDQYMSQLVTLVDTLPEKEFIIAVTAGGGSTAVNTGFMRLGFVEPDKRERTQQELADWLNKELKRNNFARAYATQEQTIGGGMRSGLPVQYVLQAPDIESLKAMLPRFMEKAAASKVFQVVDVNLKFNKPELRIEIDRDRASALGVSVRDIAENLQLFFSGQRYGYFIFHGKQYQVIGQASRSNRDEPADLAALYVRNKNGELIQMSNLVKMVEQSNPPQLYRFNRYSAATIAAQPAEGLTVGQGIDEMNRIAAEVLPENFSTSLAGTSRELAESSGSLLYAFLFSIVLIYLVLAAQFESFADPLIIMFTVPLAMAGAVLSLWLFGQTLNLFSQIGIIVLIGIVTKNGILIVEFANQRKNSGLSLREAVLDAATQRLRPILMTSLATVLGALPIAMALGAAAKSRVPMGITIIGGLLFSLLLTLYVIPALYTYVSREKKTVQYMKKILFSILSVVGLGLASPAQQSLSLAEALSLALENNYDVKTATINLSIAGNNNSAGEAGYLPTLSVSSNYTENISNSRQQYYDGRLREATDARSNSLTAGASLQWTLFDGLGMWLTDKKLDLLEKTEELILRDKMEATLATVTTTYLEAVQQTKRIETLRNTLRYDHQLLNLSRKRWTIGMGWELDYLKVVADLNADSAALLRQEASLRASLIALNTLLAIDPETTPVLTDTLTAPANPPLTFEELSAPLESNTQIVQATVRAEVARYESRIARSVQYPRLQFAAGYNYTKSTSATGLVESNRSFGPSAGISLSYTLFDGFKSRHKIANADLTTQNANLQAEQTRLAIRATLQTLFSRYEAGLRLVSLQQSNLLVVKKNLDVAFSAFKSGQMAGIDLRQYQIQLLDATDNLLQSQYDLKVTETELLRLSGRILP